MREYCLEDLFDLQMGKTPARENSEYWNNGNNDWISIRDLSGYNKYVNQTKEQLTDLAITESGIKEIPPNTVIMSFKLSIGKLAITTEKIYSNEAIMAFIDKKIVKVSSDYLYYLLLSKDWNEGTNKAVMGKTLNKATLSKVKIKLHVIKEQEEIVSVLDKVNKLVTLKKQQLEDLDNLIKSRFVEMFGDPVQNPFGWTTKPFLECGNCKNGMNFGAGEEGVELKYLGVGDFKNLTKIEDVTKLGHVGLNKVPSGEYILKDGDIVFVRSNGNKALVGRCLAVYPNGIPTTYSGFCIRYRKTDKSIEVPYLLQVLKTDSMRLMVAGRGANIQNLNQQILGQLQIPVPPNELQMQFVQFMEQVDKLKFIKTKSNQ